MYKPVYSNCLVFAIINRLLYGGKIIAYRLFPFPHFMWLDKRGRTWSYTSICKYHKGNHDDLITCVWFKGAAVRKFLK